MIRLGKRFPNQDGSPRKTRIKKTPTFLNSFWVALDSNRRRNEHETVFFKFCSHYDPCGSLLLGLAFLLMNLFRLHRVTSVEEWSLKQIFISLTLTKVESNELSIRRWKQIFMLLSLGKVISHYPVLKKVKTRKTDSKICINTGSLPTIQ